MNATTHELDVEARSADGTALRGRLWAADNPRGVVVVAHGLGEHGGVYAETAAMIGASAGVDVVAFDFRGHGRSAGKRGVVGRHEDFGGDLQAAIGWARLERPGRPVFALGHSNGGLIALRAALERPDDFAGLILSSPTLRLIDVVPRWKWLAGRVLRRVGPGITLPTDLRIEELTREPTALESRPLDPLRHGRVNAELFFGMIESGARVAALAPTLRVPTLLLLGGSDPIVDHRAALAAFEAFGTADKTAIVYPEMVHEPLCEIGRERVHADLLNWLAPRLDRGN